MREHWDDSYETRVLNFSTRPFLDRNRLEIIIRKVLCEATGFGHTLGHAHDGRLEMFIFRILIRLNMA